MAPALPQPLQRMHTSGAGSLVRRALRLRSCLLATCALPSPPEKRQTPLHRRNRAKPRRHLASPGIAPHRHPCRDARCGSVVRVRRDRESPRANLARGMKQTSKMQGPEDLFEVCLFDALELIVERCASLQSAHVNADLAEAVSDSSASLRHSLLCRLAPFVHGQICFLSRPCDTPDKPQR